MQYYLAPMEGITTYIYRNAYARYFGHIDKYFTPFIASKKMNAKEVRDILPENNTGLKVIPQILTNRVNDFLAIADRIAYYGYQTVNLNLGCPSGTVTAKKRGAGFLSVPEELDAFLYEIYEKCPMKISIKTRIGISQLNEWDSLLDIYAKYPVEELIIHARLQKEFYTGIPHPEAYVKAADKFISLCYNGDIVSSQSLETLLSELAVQNCNPPDSVMIGRGIIRNPGLTGQLKMQNCTAHTGSAGQLGTQSCTAHTGSAGQLGTQNCTAHTGSADTKQVWLDFHNEILENYRKIMSGDLPVLFKMKDLWTYMSQSFTDSEKYLKKIRKANRISEYEIIVNALFREQEIIV